MEDPIAQPTTVTTSTRPKSVDSIVRFVTLVLLLCCGVYKQKIYGCDILLGNSSTLGTTTTLLNITQPLRSLSAVFHHVHTFLEIDHSRSIKVTSNVAVGLPIHDFLVVFNSNS